MTYTIIILLILAQLVMMLVTRFILLIEKTWNFGILVYGRIEQGKSGLELIDSFLVIMWPAGLLIGLIGIGIHILEIISQSSFSISPFAKIDKWIVDKFS